MLAQSHPPYILLACTIFDVSTVKHTLYFVSMYYIFGTVKHTLFDVGTVTHTLHFVSMCYI